MTLAPSRGPSRGTLPNPYRPRAAPRTRRCVPHSGSGRSVPGPSPRGICAAEPGSAPASDPRGPTRPFPGRLLFPGGREQDFAPCGQCGARSDSAPFIVAPFADDELDLVVRFEVRQVGPEIAAFFSGSGGFQVEHDGDPPVDGQQCREPRSSPVKRGIPRRRGPPEIVAGGLRQGLSARRRRAAHQSPPPSPGSGRCSSAARHGRRRRCRSTRTATGIPQAHERRGPAHPTGLP